MGLISKIEDKLSGSKHEDQNRLEKSGRKSYEDGGNPRIQNPVSSAEKHGHGASSQGYKQSGAVDQDGYGSGTHASGPGDSGAYGSQGYGQQPSDKYDQSTGDSQYSSGGPRQPFDPYSSKGQNAAAHAVTGDSKHHGHHGHGHPRSEETGYGSTGAGQGYGSSTDPDVSRSRHGGVTNSMEDPQYSSSRRNETSIPTAGGQRIGESGGYDSGAHTGSGHHYGRDAAVAGGAGAAGVGAYEASKMHSGGRDSGAMQYSGGQRYADSTTAARMGQSGGSGGYGHTQAGPYESQGRSSYDAPQGRSSYEEPGMTSGGMGSTGMGSTGMTGSNIASGTSNVPKEPSGLPQAKKMGGAYERGYQDAIEHMQAEMRGK